MTFTEIQSAVMERLNLSSPDAQARIGRFINDRYKRVTSSIGINTSRRGTASVNTVAGTNTVTLALAKPELVYITNTGQKRVLEEHSYDDLKSRIVVGPVPSGYPTEYAIQSQDGTGVTLLLYPTPSGVFTLYSDGLLNASTLSGTNVPAFDADFHDLLVFGAMADEYQKMEKPNQALLFDKQFEQRLSDLRYFIAKSAYVKRRSR